MFSILRTAQAKGTGTDSTSCVWHKMEACSLRCFMFVIATHIDIPELSCGLTKWQARVGVHLQALPFSGTD